MSSVSVFIKTECHDSIWKLGSSWITLWSKAVMKYFIHGVWSACLLAEYDMCKLRPGSAVLFNNNFFTLLTSLIHDRCHVKGLMLLKTPMNHCQ